MVVVDVVVDVVVVVVVVDVVVVVASALDSDVQALPHPASATIASVSPTRITDLGMVAVSATRGAAIRAKGPVREQMRP